jgi:hypothetical protein
MGQVMRADAVPTVWFLEEVEAAADLDGPAVVDADLPVVNPVVHGHLQLGRRMHPQVHLRQRSGTVKGA